MQRAALMGAVFATAVIAIRAVFGPLQIGSVSLSSPLGPESLFAACLLLLVFLRAKNQFATQPSAPSRSQGWHVALLAAAVIAAFAPNLTAPFLSDDYILVQTPTLQMRQVWQWFALPGGDGSYRPLGYIAFALVGRFAGTNPLIWHVCGLFLHMANSVLLYCLVLRLWNQPRHALAAGLLFGLHGTRPEAVSWTASGFDLLATACVLAALLLWSPGTGTRIRLILVPFLVIAGVLFKESAYAAPMLMIALAYSTGRLNRETRISVGLVTTSCVGLFCYRWHLFHGPGGYVSAVTGRPQILSLHCVSALKALFLRVWAILFFPINWSPPMTLVTRVAIPAGCLALLWMTWAARPVLRREAFGLYACVVVCVLPAIHLALIGENALGSRILYLPAVGFSILIGALLARLPRRGGALWVVVLFGFSMIAVVEHNLSAWRTAGRQADILCAELTRTKGSREKVPGTLDGVYFFQNGLQACIASKSK